ncbi:MAG: hypothetical protein KDE09_24445, partial [Anaerolineales bacterium]|nr:hypothetical protein [Anaerolineales bacterium]
MDESQPHSIIHGVKFSDKALEDAQSMDNDDPHPTSGPGASPALVLPTSDWELQGIEGQVVLTALHQTHDV